MNLCKISPNLCKGEILFPFWVYLGNQRNMFSIKELEYERQLVREELGLLQTSFLRVYQKSQRFF